MGKKTEALKLALEALEEARLHIWLGDEKGVSANIKCHQTITTIREALAEQPAQQQEPVAKKTYIGLVTSYGWDSLPVGTEFYTSPPASKPWVGLTDEEIEECKINGGLPHAINWRLSVKVMEAKLKEKNA